MMMISNTKITTARMMWRSPSSARCPHCPCAVQQKNGDVPQSRYAESRWSLEEVTS